MSNEAGSDEMAQNDVATRRQIDTRLAHGCSHDVPAVKFADHSVKDAWGHTYFVRRGDAIKIGHSALPKQRMAALQASFPDRLQVLAVIPNTIIDELTAHRKFDHLRIGGEWFRIAPDLLEFIEQVKAEATRMNQSPPEVVEVDSRFEEMRGSLDAMRLKYGADSPKGHICSNLIGQLKALETYVRPDWASHETQTLPWLMKKQMARLVG